MKERAVILGAEPGLVGIVSEPDGAAVRRPACILINAGLVHRVGPNRLHVRLGRELAAAGFRALRLDLSGRGDSEARRDGVSFLESSILEIQSAMDFLEKSGSETFILMGICSGGLNGLQVAIVDPRVAGCVAIDGPAYPTPGYYLRYYARRALSAETWANTFAGRNTIGRWLRGGRRGNGGGAAEPPEVNPFGDVRVPTRAEAGESLKAIVSRGTRLFFIFSGSWTAYNYRGQFADAFPFIRQSNDVTVEYYPTSDHTFTRLYHQRRLVETVRAWVTRNWPAGESTPAAAAEERQAAS